MDTTLRLLDEFKAVLKNYQISSDSHTILQKTKLVLLAAPTSSGRNTIVRELLKTGEYHYIISDTTRPPRINDGKLETNGTEYWFRSEEEILGDLKAGKYLEAALIHNQQVSGISIRELETAHKSNKIAITDIEVTGTHTIVTAKPDTIVLFILPPSFNEWLRRIEKRGHMTPDEFRRRMESAHKEFKAALEQPYYKFVINDTIENAIEYIHQIAKQDIVDSTQQDAARELCEQLYSQTETFLKNA